MMAGYLQALGVVFENEGGLADHEADRGGRTNFGITTDTWRRWLESQGKAFVPVDDATPEDARQIYWRWYWLEGKCDGLPWPLSLVHFDSCVNHGVGTAARLLQKALGVKQDGIIGPMTLGAASVERARDQALDLIWVRLWKYRRICQMDDSQTVFLNGWVKRMSDLRDVVLGRTQLEAA